jgi:hypothetical protein
MKRFSKMVSRMTEAPVARLIGEARDVLELERIRRQERGDHQRKRRILRAGDHDTAFELDTAGDFDSILAYLLGVLWPSSAGAHQDGSFALAGRFCTGRAFGLPAVTAASACGALRRRKLSRNALTRRFSRSLFSFADTRFPCDQPACR